MKREIGMHSENDPGCNRTAILVASGSNLISEKRVAGWGAETSADSRNFPKASRRVNLPPSGNLSSPSLSLSSLSGFEWASASDRSEFPLAMAEAVVIDPVPRQRSDGNEAFNANFAADLDLFQFPEVPADMALQPGFAADLDLDADLDFEGDLDFSVADLLDFTEVDDDLLLDGEAVGCAAPLSFSGLDSKGASGVSSSSSASGNPGEGSPERSRNLNAPSPDSGDSTTCCADFREASSGAGEARVKLEDEQEKKGWDAKRKKGTDDGELSDTDINAVSRSSKYRRSGFSDQGDSSCVFSAGNEDEEKRKARLMRNRESAQLSRQRKKHYVEELEEKVKSMHSTITDLNRKISFIMAENASLRQQMGGGGNAGSSSRPAVYPPPLPMTSMHFPWIPYSGYPPRPQGAQVPLVPIPRLKQQQVTSAPKPRKSENRKQESKTKKVASVSILGLIFCMLFVGVLVPGAMHTRDRGRDLVLSEEKYSNNKAVVHPRGRVLTVRGSTERPNPTDKLGSTAPKEKAPHQSSNFSGNSSKSLFASLYVPRNDKLVKIDGNLIIQSVLASEKAMAGSGSAARSSSGEEQSDKERKETTSLAIAGTLGLALPVSKSGRETERNAHLQRSLAHSSKSRCGDDPKKAHSDAPVKEWFQEGLEGPILSSGMCTEVFSFEVAAGAAAVIPASTAANSSRIGKTKNRRALQPHPQPIPLPSGSPPNGTSAGGGAAASMVVSVLVDPREVNDDFDGGVLSSKSISRVFVVVLLDSVKYVTYSCVLPFKTHHL